MTLTCPDCGKDAAFVKVHLMVNPDDNSIEALSPQVSLLTAMTINDFPEDLEVECQACECVVPLRLAAKATERKRTLLIFVERAEGLLHDLQGFAHFWGHLRPCIGIKSEEQLQALEACERILSNRGLLDTGEEE